MKKLLLVILFFNFITVQTVVTPIKSIERFNHKIINDPLVVAYLYESEPTCIETDKACDKQYRQERKHTIAKNKEVLKAVSRDDRYQAAGLSFIHANLSHHNLCGLKREYQLTDQDSLLLFTKETSEDRSIIGTFNRSQVENLIEGQWKNKIEETLKQQAEERKQRLAELKASAAYWGTGPYWGWPYGPYGWGGCGYGGGYGGCGNGYFSVGFGFGGCC